MATVQPGVWGIDLGQCALKALRLEMIEGELTATAFDYIEHPKILSQPDADPDALTREALDKFLANNAIKGDLIAISVPGQTGLARFVKLPPVEPKKIPDIVKFEAKQQIPFPLDEVVWDYQTIGSGGQTEGFVENEIGLFAMKRDMINRYLQAFKDVGVEVHFVQMAPLALCNYVAFDVLGKGGPGGASVNGEDEGKHNCVVALDIGADNTSLVITDGEKIIWQRPIPIGGNHFTRALTKDLKLTFAKAEHLKRNATKAEDPRKIFQSMKPVFSDFVGELQRSLGFFTNTHRNAQIKTILGLGNAFRLPGLQKFINQSLGMDLDKPAGFGRIQGEEVTRSPVYADNILSFPVAYGLALQGLQQSRLHTNLLPKEVQVERVIRGKKPWAAAAAACLLLGTTVLTFFLANQHGKASAAAGAAKEADSVLRQKADFISRFNTEREATKKEIEAAASILRGGEERANWLALYRFLNDCLPQPNGLNLPYDPKNPEDTKSPYMMYYGNNPNARTAGERQQEHLERGALYEETHLAHLVQLNIQSAFCRYCDVPLATRFFNQVKTDTMVRESIADPEWNEAPKHPGWAFELRGFTYHEAKDRFIMNTLVRNLRNGPPLFFRKGVWAPRNDPSGKWTPLKISHVAIYKYQNSPEEGPGRFPDFRFIRNSSLWLDQILGGDATGRVTAAPAAGNVASGPVNPETGSRDGEGGGQTSTMVRQGSWSGLGGAIGSTGYASGGPASPDTGSPDGVTGERLTPSSKPADAKPAGKPGKTERVARTEFVVVFYWVEALPTESYTGSADLGVATGVAETSSFGGPSGGSFGPVSTGTVGGASAAQGYGGGPSMMPDVSGMRMPENYPTGGLPGKGGRPGANYPGSPQPQSVGKPGS